MENFDPMEGLGSEELLSLLDAYERSGKRFGDMPQDLQDMLNNIKKRKGQRVAEAESEEVVPTPGFVLKTADENGVKVFINVCQSEGLPMPSSWPSGVLPDHVAEALDRAGSMQELDDQEFEALRLPMACGDLRDDTDKKGEPCKTADCVVNPGVLLLAGQSREFKVFLCNLTLDQVSSKHKVNLDRKFKLPKMTYKGETFVSQRVRKEPKSLVTDLGDVPEEPSFPLRPSKKQLGDVSNTSRQKVATGAAAGPQRDAKAELQESRAAAGAAASTSGRSAAAAAGRGSSSSSKLPSLQHSLKCHGKPVEKVLVDVQLPSKAETSATAGDPGSSSSSSEWSSKDVDVRVAGMELLVHAAGCEQLSVQLPFAVAAELAGVELDAGSGGLHIELPFLPVGLYVEELREAAPVSFGVLPVDHAAYLELDS